MFIELVVGGWENGAAYVWSLTKELFGFCKKVPGQASKSFKELFRDAGSDLHYILDTCSLSIVLTPAHYTTGSSTLIQDSRKKVEITEGRMHPFVVSELLQVHGETKLKTDMDCALKHCSQVKETEKYIITLQGSGEITIKGKIQVLWEHKRGTWYQGGSLCNTHAMKDTKEVD